MKQDKKILNIIDYNVGIAIQNLNKLNSKYYKNKISSNRGKYNSKQIKLW